MNRRGMISLYLVVLLAVAGTGASLATSAYVSLRQDGMRREARIQAYELAAAAAALDPGQRLELDGWVLQRAGDTSSAQGPLAACQLQWSGGRILSVSYETAADQQGLAR